MNHADFDIVNKNDINEAQARQSQLTLIKVVRRMSGLDLISAKRWVEEYLSKP
jgi:ribosomal protein L7/L12